MIAQTLLPTIPPKIKHPAKFTDALLPIMSRYLRRGWRVYDPFGGVGGLQKIEAATGAQIFCGEIEYKVIASAMTPRSVNANAEYLPFANECFDVLATSPTYGNRLGDASPRPGSAGKWKTYSYRLTFGFELNPRNSGSTQFSAKYKEIHERAWRECIRVLKPRGLFILNISDHIRAGKRVYVSKWHLDTLRALGLTLERTHAVKTPRLRFGANAEKRCVCEYVFVMRKP